MPKNTGINMTSEDLSNVATTMTAMSAILGCLVAAVKSVFKKVDDTVETHNEQDSINALEALCSEIDLKNHHFYTNVSHLKSKALTLDGVTNEGREALFQMILESHIEIFEKYAEMLYNNYAEGLIPSKDHLRSHVHSMYSKFYEEFYNFHKNIPYLDNDEKKAIDIVLKHYNKWNSNRMNGFLSRVDQICSADYYPTIFSSIVAILDTSYLLFVDLTEDLQTSAQYINGELSGLTFKGVEL